MSRRYVKPTKLQDLPEHLISDPAQMPGCLEHLSKSPAIGFDTEFVGEDAYRPELCLVQVSTPEQLFIIDPLRVGSLEEFWNILLEPGRTTVLHAGREDIRMCFFQSGKPPSDVFDVQLAAGLVGLTYPIGYAGLVNDLLGQRMTKGETLTDWRRRPLTPAQVRYAFDDVRYLLPAWKKLTERLRRLKRSDWATEEFTCAVRKAIGDEEFTTEKWRRIKGIGGLDRRQLAIAREVFVWRETFAERVNRPARQLLRDDILTEIARRVPLKTEDLTAYRGVPRNEIDRIIDAVKRAKSLPAEECPLLEPRENDPPHVVLLANLLGVVLTDWCGRNKLATNLVASGSDLKAIVRSRVFNEPPPDVPLNRGWRASVILTELDAILEGKTAIRVKNPSAATPLGFLPIPQPATNPIPSEPIRKPDDLPPAVID